jgi:hypothetical protein
MYDYRGNLTWTSNFVEEKVNNHIIQLVDGAPFVYGLSLNCDVYRIDKLNGVSVIIKNNIKFIINEKTYIDINDKFIKLD